MSSNKTAVAIEARRTSNPLDVVPDQIVANAPRLCPRNRRADHTNPRGSRQCWRLCHTTCQPDWSSCNRYRRLRRFAVRPKPGCRKVLKPGGILVSVMSPVSDTAQKRYGVRAVFCYVAVTTSRLNKITEVFDSRKLITDVGTVLPLGKSTNCRRGACRSATVTSR